MAANRYRIAEVRTYVPATGREGGDYHAQQGNHWIIDSRHCQSHVCLPGIQGEPHELGH